MTIKKLQLKAKLYFALHPDETHSLFDCAKRCKYYKKCNRPWPAAWPWNGDKRYTYYHHAAPQFGQVCIKWLDDKK